MDATSISTIPPRLASQVDAARSFHVHDRTIFRWLTAGYITGYKSGTHVLVDLDEIERELLTNPNMRDGRRPRYGKATIVEIGPVRRRVFRAEVVPEPEVEQ
jgi:excisionase family DNA binding protein